MPDGSWNQIYVGCPFYKDDRGLTITCEGFGDAESTKFVFANGNDKKKQMEVFCYQHYEKCEYNMLLRKYKYEEEWPMKMDDAIAIKKPEPDSQYRLVPCKCGSDNVAYVHYHVTGGNAWRVQCFDCGHVVGGYETRHDAQLAWNEAVKG